MLILYALPDPEIEHVSNIGIVSESIQKIATSIFSFSHNK